MTVINIEAQNPLAEIVKRGEEFVISMDGRHVARVMPYARPIAEPTLDEQLLEALDRYEKRNNIPTVTLEVDENGYIIVDENLKNQHPDVYDWLVNG